MRILIALIVIVLWGTSLFYALGLGGLAGLHRPELISTPARMAMPLATTLMGKPCSRGDRTQCGIKDTSGRQEVDCGRFRNANGSSNDNGNNRTAILFAFGQSNSANAGSSRYSAGEQVFNFNPHDGRCYRAKDPLLGPDGNGGAVWGVLGDQLIAEGLYDQVLVAPFGIGGTEIERWSPEGDLHPRVVMTATRLTKNGINPTHVLWHQGESNANGMATEDYIAHFGALLAALRSYGIDAPVLPAIATICTNDGSDAIRAAQRALPQRFANVYAGADTDSLRAPRYRYDDCHFSRDGMQAHAALWVEAMRAVPEQ